MPDPQILHHVFLGVCLLFLIGSFSRKIYFVCAYLMILINRPGIYYPVLGQLRFELIVAIWGVLLIVFSRETSRLLSVKRNKIVRYGFYFFMVIFLSMLQAFNFIYSWQWVYQTVLPNILIAMLLLVYCKDKKDIQLVLWVYSITMASLGYEAVFRYLMGDVVDLEDTGIGGFQFATAEKGRAAAHTSLANYFLYAMPFLWYLGNASQKMLAKWSGFGLFVFCIVGILISGSRGGLVGLVIMFILIALFSEHTMILLSVGLAILIMSIPMMGEQYLNRMATIRDLGASDVSARSRWDGLINGIEMMIKRPVLGVGPGCYPLVRKALFGWGLWSHNIYGQLAGELGIIGVIVWFRFMRQYLKSCWKFRKIISAEPWVKSMATAILVSSCVALALGMFSHSLYSFIWIIMAVVTINLAEIAQNITNPAS